MNESHPNIKKSEELREAIRGGRKVTKEDTDRSSTPSKTQDQPTKHKKIPSKVSNLASQKTDRSDDQKDEYGSSENQLEREETKDDKKRTFLKKKTKAVQFQKLKWKGQSRIDCWGKKDEKAESRSPSPEEKKAMLRTQARSPKIQTKTQQLAASRSKSPNFDNKFKTMGSMGATGGMNATGSMDMRQTRSKFKDGHEEKARMASPGMRNNVQNRNHIQGGQNMRSAANLASQQQQLANIRIDDLEKAFNTNFLSKYNAMTAKFFAENSIRDPKYQESTLLPIMKFDSEFMQNFQISEYKEILEELDEQYKALQMIS